MKYLILDDELYARKGLEKIIKEYDKTAECMSTHSPVQALEYLQKEKIEVILSDIQMPEMNGIDFVKRVKEISPESAVILVTAYQNYMLDAFRLYVTGYILKPVNPDELKEALEHLRPLKANTKQKIVAKCYGNFDFFVDGKSIHFLRSKAKELLAYLIWMQGSSITTAEAMAVLFGDKEVTRSLSSQMQTIISSLKRTLEEAGVGELLRKETNSLSINADMITCDLYHDKQLSEQTGKKIDSMNYFQCYDWMVRY